MWYSYRNVQEKSISQVKLKANFTEMKSQMLQAFFSLIIRFYVYWIFEKLSYSIKLYELHSDVQSFKYTDFFSPEIYILCFKLFALNTVVLLQFAFQSDSCPERNTKNRICRCCFYLSFRWTNIKLSDFGFSFFISLLPRLRLYFSLDFK